MCRAKIEDWAVVHDHRRVLQREHPGRERLHPGHQRRDRVQLPVHPGEVEPGGEHGPSTASELGSEASAPGMATAFIPVATAPAPNAKDPFAAATAPWPSATAPGADALVLDPILTLEARSK